MGQGSKREPVLTPVHAMFVRGILDNLLAHPEQWSSTTAVVVPRPDKDEQAFISTPKKRKR